MPGSTPASKARSRTTKSATWKPGWSKPGFSKIQSNSNLAIKMPAKYPQNTCKIPSKHHQRARFAICMCFEGILLKPGLLQPGLHVAGFTVCHRRPPELQHFKVGSQVITLLHYVMTCYSAWYHSIVLVFKHVAWCYITKLPLHDIVWVGCVKEY